MSGHDFEHQKAETLWTVAELLRLNDALTEGQHITLDLQFLPGAAADPDAAIRALKMFGYSASQTDDGEVEIQIPDVPFTAEAIWLHEERCTRIAIERGFTPDGWGFWGD